MQDHHATFQLFASEYDPQSDRNFRLMRSRCFASCSSSALAGETRRSAIMSVDNSRIPGVVGYIKSRLTELINRAV